MGKRPFWLRDALNAGRTLEGFATGPSPAKPKIAKPSHQGRERPRSFFVTTLVTPASVAPRAEEWLQSSADSTGRCNTLKLP